MQSSRKSDRRTGGLSRRTFLGTSVAAAGAAVAFPYFVPSRAFGANARLRVASIGAGGQATVDITHVAAAGADIVALCDVHDQRAAAMFNAYPKASRYRDYRVMLEKEQAAIDAVIIATPDHIHAPATMMALRAGKHVYVQKPLTHTVHEARVLLAAAREAKVVTQMGNHGHSDPDTRRLVEIIRSGALGNVSEVHIWTDRPIWPQGMGAPKGAPPVPENFDWNLWLGPAAERPYHRAYQPFSWRAYWDFGTGALGDMGCHNADMPFFALGLRDPVAVTARASGADAVTAPEWAVIDYDFAPSAQNKLPIKMTWYDGGKKPPAELAKSLPAGEALPANGVIVVGDKDTLYVPSYWGPGTFASGRKMADFTDVPASLAKPAPGDLAQSHHAEWVNACTGGPPTLSNFEFAAPMTEALLLGNLALRTATAEAGAEAKSQRLEWDAASLKVTNSATATQLVSKEYRKGWEL